MAWTLMAVHQGTGAHGAGDSVPFFLRVVCLYNNIGRF